MEKQAVVAMSGGVDSTVTALLAQRMGYRVTGVNLKLRHEDTVDTALVNSCHALGIKLVIRDCADAFFDRVLLPGAREYAAGRTPNPCCECNEVLKFHEIIAAADELGIKTVFTGHYVKLVPDENGDNRIASARDAGKDQSYFLYRVGADVLNRCILPLGDLSKAEVREIAAGAGLQCAARPDSQDACFQVAGECCGDTLSRLCRVCGKSGRFIYNGKTVGKHNGIHRYTIGQRQGLGVALGVPAYVKRIDGRKGNIELCTDQQELACSEFKLTRAVWNWGVPAADETLMVRVRYRSGACVCRYHGDRSGGIVVLDSAQRAVTPGQAAVFYDSSGLLLGGGVIDLSDAALENSQPQ